MNRFAVTADDHIIASAWKRYPEISGDAYDSFAFKIAYCIKEKLNLVMAGDVFDAHYPEPEDLKFFIAQAGRMRTAGLWIYFIQGQHEFKATPWVSAVCGGDLNVAHVNKRLFSPCESARLYGMDNGTKEEMEMAVAGIPQEASGVVIHQYVKGVAPSWNFDPDTLPEWVRLCLAGDYHKPEEFKWRKDCYGTYIGSQHVMSIDESHDKSFVVVTASKNGSFTIDRVAVPCRRKLEVSIVTEQQAVEVLKSVRAHAAGGNLKPLLRVKYAVDIPAIWERVCDAAGDRFHVFPEPMTQTELIVESDAAAPARGEVTLESELPAFTEEGSEERAFLSDLITKTDTSAVLESWRSNYDVH